MSQRNMDLLLDMPSGPLDDYRRRSKFNWKNLRLFLFGEQQLLFMKEAYSFLQSNPVFCNTARDLSLEEERALTHQRVKYITNNTQLFYTDDYFSNYEKVAILTYVLANYDMIVQVKKSLYKDMCVNTIMDIGTQRHRKYIQSLTNNEVGFCFCLTEIGHGSNTKAIRTEARYHRQTQSFILNTPDFEAAKAWSGGLGKTATFSILYAQLFTPDGKCHGVHSFIVPIRNPNTMLPYPGITIIDMGPKAGSNGIDNGVASFENYSIPRENLLNRISDVTPEGNYVSVVKDTATKMGITLGSLVTGRVGITSYGQINMAKAVSIAIRYSAVRRQFKSETSKEEQPVIEYPVQQWKLFPHLVNCYVIFEFTKMLREHYAKFKDLHKTELNSSSMGLYMEEIHALSCSSKPISGWWAQTAIQECREACGGHGYLKAAGFGDLRNTNDTLVTVEGTNNVLIQQTSNWLVKIWSDRYTRTYEYPMDTINFFNNFKTILNLKWNKNALSLNLTDENIINKCIEGLEWLICYLCSITFEEVKDIKYYTPSMKNNIQLFKAYPLCFVYLESVMLKWYLESISKCNTELRYPLLRLGAYFGIQRLHNHFEYFIQGKLLLEPDQTIKDIQSHIIRLLREILEDAVALVDAMAPPDFCLRSCLGNSDGRKQICIILKSSQSSTNVNKISTLYQSYISDNRQ